MPQSIGIYCRGKGVSISTARVQIETARVRLVLEIETAKADRRVEHHAAGLHGAGSITRGRTPERRPQLEHVERHRKVHREQVDREREHLRGLYRELERVDEDRKLRIGPEELVRGHERVELLLGHREHHEKEHLRQLSM